MSDHDDDLRAAFRSAAERAKPAAGAEARLLKDARRRRGVTAAAATMAVVVLVGGLAGAATLLGGRDGIKPAPGPEETRVTQNDLASMTVDELAAALFKDDELEDAVPTEAGFSLREIVRNGPERTNHDYATVGVQMSGPVPSARAIFFVHPTERDAAEMGVRRSEAASLPRKNPPDGSAGVAKPFAVPNALPGTICSPLYDQLLSCHAVLGRVVVLTQSSAGQGQAAEITADEVGAAATLIRSFGLYLERVYPQSQNQADEDCADARPPRTASSAGFPLRPRQEGSNEVVPVVFPDGTSAELVYPSEMSSESATVPFDELLARPYPAGGPRGRMIRPKILYDGVPAEYEANTLVDCIQGRDGPVPVWNSRAGKLIDLVFGRWHVVVTGGRSAQEVWAQELQGEVVQGGWLVLRGGDNLFIGPENDPGDANLMLTRDDTILDLQINDCRGQSSDEGPPGSAGEDGFASFCLEDALMEVHVQGEPEFVQSVYDNLQVRNVTRAFPIEMYITMP